jgi:ankyrin repeat protein
MNSIDYELNVAARENNLPEVRQLLIAGAGVNAKDHNDETPLHWARLHENLEIVNDVMCPNDSNGATTSILDKRKSRGADVEAKTDQGDTPLHLASWGGHLAVIKRLRGGGADILAANNGGKMPIHNAVDYGKSAVAKYLLQEFYATTRRLPLHELLEDLTWSYNAGITSGAPPFRYALDANVLGTDDVVDILEFLVDRNPELLSSHEQDGSLPLHVACRRGAPFTIVQFLVNRYKASVKSVTSEGGDLPLFLACNIPEPSLDTIFLLIKLYPELVYR